MLADQLLDLRRGDGLLILAYGRLYKEVRTVFAETKGLGLATVLVTEGENTPLAKLADVAVGFRAGGPEQVSLAWCHAWSGLKPWCSRSRPPDRKRH